MRAAFDEILAAGLKHKQPVQQIIGELLCVEIAEKQARSIKYQLTIAKLPLAKELADFCFADTPVNEALVRELATGERSWHSNATPSSSAARVPERRIYPLPSHVVASAAALGVASTRRSPWPTGSRPRPAKRGRGASPIA